MNSPYRWFMARSSPSWPSSIRPTPAASKIAREVSWCAWIVSSARASARSPRSARAWAVRATSRPAEIASEPTPAISGIITR